MFPSDFLRSNMLLHLLILENSVAGMSFQDLGLTVRG